MSELEFISDPGSFNHDGVERRSSQRIKGVDEPDIGAPTAKQLKGKDNEAWIPRNKERTVGYVIEKVAQWRRLYNGFYD